MDIYKISDDLTETPKNTEISVYKITNLKQGVKDSNRVNVYVNSEFAFSLDISQVVNLGVKVGLEISEDELVEFRRASEFGKLYQRALEWVLARPHSEKECRDYLRRKIFEKKLDKNHIDIIIDKLKTKKYLDDVRFAEWYIENRFAKKGVSVKRLKMELLKKGVSKDITEQVLENSDRNDRGELEKMILKKRSKYREDEKLIAYLVRQGFSYDLVREVLQSFETE
ncbi:regulatory protein RecX [Candidatus Saccharibacteria bacterium]|nr:regulatory protein RecX [Candidatus Saccharibacteria bacterium]